MGHPVQLPAVIFAQEDVRQAGLFAEVEGAQQKVFPRRPSRWR